MSATLNANTGQLIVSRGDDVQVRYTVKNSAGNAYDVSGNSFKFTVKSSIDDVIGDAEFQKTNPAASGIDLTQAATGIVDVNIADTDTNALAGAYQYDFEMTESGKVYTLAQGMFTVRKDVTTPGAAGSPTSALVDFPVGLSVTEIYMKDSVLAGYWKGEWNNGSLDWTYGTSIPF